jgi:hypothetical protein
VDSDRLIGLPDWTLTAPYSRVESAWRAGQLTDDTWIAYRAVWRYGAARLSDVVPWPPVRAIYAYLERGAVPGDTIRVTWAGAGTQDHCTQHWPPTFANAGSWD